MLDRSIAPQIEEIAGFTFPHPQFQVLSNGIEFYFLHDPKLDIIKLDLFFEAGSWYESTYGVSQFTAGLFKEGTKKHSAAEIHAGIESLGAFVEMNSNADNLLISIYSLSENVGNVLRLISEILTESVFSEEELTNFKQVQISRLKINLEKTSYRARSLFNSLVMGEGNPYGHIFTEDDIHLIQREHLIQFFRDFVKGHPFVLMASGNLSDRQLGDIEKFLGSLPVDGAKKEVKHELTFTRDSRVEDIPGAVQSSLIVGKRMPPRKHGDVHANTVVNEIIGGYFGSRLMKNLREDKGYTYGMHSRIYHLKNVSYLAISADVIKESRDSALEEVRKELVRMAEVAVGLDELNTVRNYMLGSIHSSLSSPFSIMQLFRMLQFHQLPLDFFEQRMKIVKEITPDQIQEKAATYFQSSEMTELIVG